MSDINKIRERLRKVDIARGEASTSVGDIPLDHQLTFNRDSNEKWSFRDGRIYLNNEDIEDALNEEHDNVRFQSAVSDAISEYKDIVYHKGNGSWSKFSARAETIQDKILHNMKRIYDERTGGIRLAWGDGAYLLNNLNVRALLAMYHVRPTEKARRFLSGLKSKLALILINKNGSCHYERINSVIKALYEEVDTALNSPPIDGRCLPAGNSDRSA